MAHFHSVTRFVQALGNVLGNHYRAVLTPGAAERDGEIALALSHIVRQQVDEHLGNAADKFLGLRK